VRAALLDQLVQSGPADRDLREYYYQAVKGLDAIMATTEVYANHGDIVEAMDTYKKKVLNQ
jgi:hypothetical protein